MTKSIKIDVAILERAEAALSGAITALSICHPDTSQFALLGIDYKWLDECRHKVEVAQSELWRLVSS